MANFQELSQAFREKLFFIWNSSSTESVVKFLDYIVAVKQNAEFAKLPKNIQLIL